MRDVGDERDDVDALAAVDALISNALHALGSSALVGDAETRESARRVGTIRGSTATLANCAVGAGVLATPFAVSKFGTVGGGALITFTALLAALTLVILVDASSALKSTSYQGVVRDAFGPNASRGVAATLVVYLFGSCVAYLIIIGDSYVRVIDAMGYDNSQDGSRPWWATRQCAIAVAAIFFVAPLSLMREMRRLAPASAVALVSLAYTATAIVFKAMEKSDVDGSARATAWSISSDSILAVPIVVFAFQCHIQVVAIYAELSNGAKNSNLADVAELDDVASSLEDEKRTERCRLRRMYVVIALAVGACFIGYLCVGEFAYIAHPDVTSNVLDSYDKHDKVMMMATIFMACSAVASFPVNHHAARAALDDLLADAFGWAHCAPGHAPVMRHASQTLAFVALTSVVAFIVTDLGKVFELIGATCGSLVMFVIPAGLLVHPKLRRRGKRSSRASALDDDLRDLDDVTRDLLSSAMGLLGDELSGDEEDEGVNHTVNENAGSTAIDISSALGATALLLIAVFVATSNVYVLFFRHVRE